MTRAKAGRYPAQGSTRGARVAKQRKKQKVVLESVSKDKDKNQLRSVLSFRADPPPGYTFIPAGNPELTAALKEFARKGQHKIFSVSTTPHATRHELSREVHRVGFHFPTEVVSQVCSHYGIRLTSGGRLIDDNKDNDKLFMKVYQKGQLVLNEKVQDQVTINTEAKQTIKDLFPNIPDKDLFQIIKTAFQLGEGKVGTAEEIPLVRRAQLSVVAHIRHVYTNYDKLLRQVAYNDARHMVEKDTLQRLVEWRGNDDEADHANRRAVDDIFKEVIVISDEEDSDSDVEEVEQLGHDNLRVEELPSHTYDFGHRPLSPLRGPQEDDAPSGYRFAPQVARRYLPNDTDMATRDRSRYAIWDQARQDYRSGVAQPAPILERVYEREPVEVQRRQLIPLDRTNYPRDEPIIMNRAPEQESYLPPRPESPTYIRGANGALYQRVVSGPVAEPREAIRNPYQRLSPPLASLPNSRPLTPRSQYRREHRRTPSLDGGDDTILPSVEGPNRDHISPPSRRNPFDRHPQAQQTPHRFVEIDRVASRVQREPAFIDLTNSDEQPSNRRRVVEGLDGQLVHNNPFVTRDQHQHPEDMRMAPPQARIYPERRIIEIGENHASPRAIVQRMPPSAYDILEPVQLPPRLPQERYREVREAEQPVVRRIILPDDDAMLRRGDDRVSVDAYGRRILYEDRVPPEPVRRVENYSSVQRVVYAESPRQPLEAIQSDEFYMDPHPRSREYLPPSQHDRLTAHPSYGPDTPAHFPRSGVASNIPPMAYSTDRRYEQIPKTTYVRN